MKPKTVKSFLKLCIAICETCRDDLKGIDKLTVEQYLALGNIRAAVQNDLGENEDLLKLFDLNENTKNR